MTTRIAWKEGGNAARNSGAGFWDDFCNDEITRYPPVGGQPGVFDWLDASGGAAPAPFVRAEAAERCTSTVPCVRPLPFAAEPDEGQLSLGSDWARLSEVVTNAGPRTPRPRSTISPAQLSTTRLDGRLAVGERDLMEDLAFPGRGQARRDVLDGFVDLDGGLPVNPDPGLTSVGHRVGSTGLKMLSRGLMMRHRTDSRCR